MSDIRGDARVAIVGAGPVGLCAAAMLVALGHRCDVWEAQTRPGTDWRASTFHAATLEILERIGITSRMVREGSQVQTFQHRDRRDGVIAEFDLSLLADETNYPYRLQLNQQRLVGMLYDDLLADRRVDLHFGQPVAGVEEGTDAVRLRIGTADSFRDVAYEYVLAADGPSSTVRKSCGIGFEGFTYEERFLIVSIGVDLRSLLPDIADVNYVADPKQWLFILRTPDSWRVLWPVPSDQASDDAMRPDVIESQLQNLAPRAGGYPILDKQIYAVHQRVASTFRRGRILLLGDAAHINSPVGGVGLNSGIHDAADATTRLDRILTGNGDADQELDEFARVRRRVALEYVRADTSRNTDRLREVDPAVRAANRAELAAIVATPERALAHLRRTTLLESVRRFGIGLPPDTFGGRRSSPPAAVGADGSSVSEGEAR